MTLTGIVGSACALPSWCLLWLQMCLYHGFYLEQLFLWVVGYCNTAHRYFALAYLYALLAPCIFLYLHQLNEKNQISQDFRWGSGSPCVSTWQRPKARPQYPVLSAVVDVSGKWGQVSRRYLHSSWRFRASLQNTILFFFPGKGL